MEFSQLRWSDRRETYTEFFVPEELDRFSLIIRTFFQLFYWPLLMPIVNLYTLILVRMARKATAEYSQNPVYSNEYNKENTSQIAPNFRIPNSHCHTFMSEMKRSGKSLIWCDHIHEVRQGTIMKKRFLTTVCHESEEHRKTVLDF